MAVRFVGMSAACVVALLSTTVRSQSSRRPRPDAGAESRRAHPDLQGTWTNNFATPLERPPELANRPLLTDEEVAALNASADRSFRDGHVMVVPTGRSLLSLLNDSSSFAGAPNYDPSFFTQVTFDNRTSLITDPPNGRLPEYTPAGQQRRDARAPAVESVQDLPPDTRCITFGMPRIAGVAGTPSAGVYAFYQTVQTADYVLFFMEAVHEARLIPLDGRPHLPPSMRSWDGDSRGRWEGDTLVVDTTNFRAEMNFLGAGEHLHLVERFRLAGPDELRYEIRVEDPTTWTRPWTAMIRLKRTHEQLYEFGCHEGNARIIEGMLAAPTQGR
jgi:hypothetical protein